MKILGIESSCDETAAAIVTGEREILSNIIFSQIEAHKQYGGVVPEIAARAHLDYIDHVIKRACTESDCDISEVDAIAVTGGPGLIGGVIVGVMTAKAIASILQKPLYMINHLEGHALSARLTEKVEFPYILLLASGGHTQLILVEGVGEYSLLGSTIDDAIGEAFDKVAKMLQLEYASGKMVEEYAKKGDPHSVKLPFAMMNRPGCDFSCSGIKTAVRREIEKRVVDAQELSMQNKYDIAASFQYTIGEIIINRVKNAFDMTESCTNLVIAGGVGANQYIRSQLVNFTTNNHINFFAPPMHLCTDNAAMIAWAAIEHVQAGISPSSLDFEPRATWPLYR